MAQIDPWLTSDIERPSKEDVEAQRRVRWAQLQDPQRPVWHFTAPEDSSWIPFDPNGAIYKDGVYHLWYLYWGQSGLSWAHVSSIDLFHWRWHREELRPDDRSPEKSMDSGNAFLAKDGKVVISYHGGETAGNCVAYSDDPELEQWTKSGNNPITDPGWDPHMWYEGDT
jgi:sucrose-6-phosphate hydrolase SacC (GH32 family)